MSEITYIDQCVDGMLLGDAYIDKHGRFGFNHSDKQRAYSEHKLQLLSEAGYKMRSSESTIPAHLIGERMVKEGKLVSVYSSRTFAWKQKRALWYPDGKKIVPTSLKITPVTLAYWYMDDGTANLRSKYISYHAGKKYAYSGEPFIQQFRLYTDGFDGTSQELLLEQLNLLGIHAWYHTRTTGHRYIVVSRLEARKRFKELVEPIVMTIPSMQYKINKTLNFQQERISEEAPSVEG